MIVARRDLRLAKDRFVLISVIILMTLPVIFPTVLTAGLGRASTSATMDLPADQLAFATPDDAPHRITTSYRASSAITGRS